MGREKQGEKNIVEGSRESKAGHEGSGGGGGGKEGWCGECCNLRWSLLK